jgi:hypothetical protein
LVDSLRLHGCKARANRRESIRRTVVPFRVIVSAARFHLRAISAIVFALLVAGCVDQAGLPPDCDEPEASREVALSATELTPDAIEVCRGQDVILNVDAGVDGVFHIHGYDEQVAATSVDAGEVLTLEFEAERSGQFPIELHPAEDPTGVTVGIFTVHEP